MEHTSSIAYDQIRELDEAVRENQDEVPEMSISSYMMPPPFKEINIPVRMEHIRNIMITSTRGVNSSNQIRMKKVVNRKTRISIKNIHTGETIEFGRRIDAARFVGTYDGMVVYEARNERARVFCIDGKEYVFVYDNVERQIIQEHKEHLPLAGGMIEAVSKTGGRTPLYSYLAAARFFGLLIGDIQEEEKREGKGELARVFLVDEEEFTMEFGERERKRSGGRCVHCHWRGVYATYP